MNLGQKREKTFISGPTDSYLDPKLATIGLFIYTPSRTDTGPEIWSKDFGKNYFTHSDKPLRFIRGEVIRFRTIEVNNLDFWSDYSLRSPPCRSTPGLVLNLKTGQTLLMYLAYLFWFNCG